MSETTKHGDHPNAVESPPETALKIHDDPHPEEGLDKKRQDEEEAEAIARKRKLQRLVFSTILAVIFTCAISIISYVIALKLGTRSVGSLGDQLQDQVANAVTIELNRRMEPLAIFLLQLVDFIDENRLDVENNDHLRLIMPVAHAFLNNYFDDSRCCFGAFINMQFPGDSGPIAPDSDVLRCHAIEAPSCPAPPSLYNSKAQWVGVLHYSNSYANQSGFYSQVLPRYPLGNATNELYFKSYQGQRVMQPSFPETPIGFVNFPYGDGYWFWVNVRYNLTKRQLRFGPIFPFDLYPPIVLKTHITTPLYSPDGRRVGAMVTGFKLHFLSRFLASLRIKDGMFTMMVERRSGYVVSTSNVAFEPLNSNNKPTLAVDITTDDRARDLARSVVNRFGGDWNSVTAYRSRQAESAGWYEVLFMPQDESDFVVVFDYVNKYGIDWIGIITIPYDSIMNDIRATQLALGACTVAIAVVMRCFAKLIELLVFAQLLTLPNA